MPTPTTTHSTEQAEQNSAVVRRIYDELINQENNALIDELVAENVIVHDPLAGEMQGREAFAQVVAGFDTAFPHHRAEVHRIVAAGEWVSVLHTHTGVHGGPFLGLPPTGRAFRVEGLELMRVVDGKVVEFWRHDDDAGLLMQLGILPMPGGN
jgi:steroid delta-isomerase-like uncharacterized protein